MIHLIPAQFSFIRGIFNFFYKLFLKLNHLEKALVPGVMMEYHKLFSSNKLDYDHLKIGAGALIACAVIFNFFETKDKVQNPKSVTHGIEPLFKAGGWVFTLFHLVQNLPNLHLPF